MRPKLVLDLPLVEIIWTDAAFDVTQEGTLDDPSAPFGGLVECRDVGYLIEKTRTAIKLATSITEEDNGYRHSNTIPRGWIRTINYLARPRDALPDTPATPEASQPG